ncbi:hypothetical protein GJAV_G00210020 [Gymnothorax javanicus]|nr:hypothetical protein GJAV_G00210020 [Gymnothorax javanicus]
MNLTMGLIHLTENSTYLEVFEEVFLGVWPFARYVLLALLLIVFAGTLLTDCITSGHRRSDAKTRTQPERSSPNAQARKEETSRISSASQEPCYEYI